MLRISGGWFAVCLIRELDVFLVFGGASYMRVRLICAILRYVDSKIDIKIK